MRILKQGRAEVVIPKWYADGKTIRRISRRSTT